VILSLLATAGCQLFGGPSGMQSGALRMSSSSLTFSTVVIGSSQTLTDTITNTAATSVTISTVTVSDAEFNITAPALPLTLAPGKSAALSIRFTPNTAGASSGQISLMTHEAVNNKHAVPVSGKAVAAGKSQ
jgi:Cep192 domain 4